MKKRIFAAVLAVVLLCVILLSCDFLLQHADHDCIGEDCLVCHQISAFADALRALLCAPVLCVGAYAAIRGLCRLSANLPTASSHKTLVSEKIRLTI
ncbi:MAG: hypothetical protein LBM28_04840 [Oscillospiraceae bacterium]|jgi:hypothetical protein|nr:hypothetical protein [Oscillospiraceae bacterium]